MFLNNQEDDLPNGNVRAFMDLNKLNASPLPDDQPPIASKPDPLAEIMKKQQDANKQKAYLGVIGSIAQSLADKPSAYELYTGKRSTRPDLKGMSSAAADSIEDPMTSQQKAYAYLKAKNDATESQSQTDYSTALKSPTSKQTMALKQIAPRWGIEVTPEMTGEDVQRLIDPKKMMETEAKSTVDFNKEKSIHELDNKARLNNSLLEIEARSKEHKQDKSSGDYEKYVEGVEKQAATLRGDDAAKLSSAKLSAIASGRALLRQYAGKENQMTPDQLSLLAADRVKAVTGGVPTSEEIRHMMPFNTGTTWSGLKSYWSDSPEPAHSGGWVKEAEKDFQVQEKAARDILKNRQTQITGNPRLRPEDKARISKMAVPPEFDSTSGPDDSFSNVVAPDGSVRKIPKAQLQSALAAGGRLVNAPPVAGGQ